MGSKTFEQIFKLAQQASAKNDKPHIKELIMTALDNHPTFVSTEDVVKLINLFRDGRDPLKKRWEDCDCDAGKCWNNEDKESGQWVQCPDCDHPGVPRCWGKGE